MAGARQSPDEYRPLRCRRPRRGPDRASARLARAERGPAPAARRALHWLGVAPLLLFAAVVFGVPTAAMVFGAFTTPATAPEGVQATGANMSASMQGAYLTALIGSVKLSAVTALIATGCALPIAYTVVTARFRFVREAVLTASGVLANFGGVALAFAFVATLGNAGVVTGRFDLTEHGWSLYSFTGLSVVYLYFLIPLMVLILTPPSTDCARSGARRHATTGPTPSATGCTSRCRS